MGGQHFPHFPFLQALLDLFGPVSSGRLAAASCQLRNRASDGTEGPTEHRKSDGKAMGNGDFTRKDWI